MGKVRLKKLREGGVEVDSFLGDINLDTVQFDIEAEDKPKVATTWDSSRTDSQAETPAVSEEQNNYAGQAEASGDWANDGGWGEDAAPEQAEEAQEDWAEAGGWVNNQQQQEGPIPLTRIVVGWHCRRARRRRRACASRHSGT